jgi:alpha-L-fucosidase 2
VKGLRARGGFTIDMSWENGKVSKLTVHSSLGGNCRLRLSSELKGSVALKALAINAVNPNPYFKKAAIATPLISEKAKTNMLNLPETTLYDFEAKPNTTYTFSKIVK